MQFIYFTSDKNKTDKQPYLKHVEEPIFWTSRNVKKIQSIFP